MNSLELARDYEALAARLGSIFLESRVAIAPFFEDASTKEALERSRTSYKVKRYSLQHIIQSVQENETYNNQWKKTYKRVTLFTTLFFFLSCGLPIRVATIRHLSPRFSYQRSIFPRKKEREARKRFLQRTIVTFLSSCFVRSTLRSSPSDPYIMFLFRWHDGSFTCHHGDNLSFCCLRTV